MPSLVKLCSLLLVFLLSVCNVVVVVKADDNQEDFKGIFQSVSDSYQELPQGGKLATGVFCGYAASKVAVKSAVSAAKVAGAAFIASEVLNYSGALDSVELSDNSAFVLKKVKNSVNNAIQDFRVTVRRRLAPKGIGNTIEGAVTKEKMATLGFACGAFVGFMV